MRVITTLKEIKDILKAYKEAYNIFEKNKFFEEVLPVFKLVIFSLGNEVFVFVYDEPYYFAFVGNKDNIEELKLLKGIIQEYEKKFDIVEFRNLFNVCIVGITSENMTAIKFYDYIRKN